MAKLNAYKIQESIAGDLSKPAELVPSKGVYFTGYDLAFLNITPEEQIIRMILDGLELSLEKLWNEREDAVAEFRDPTKPIGDAMWKITACEDKIDSVNRIIAGFMNGLLHFDYYKKVYTKHTRPIKVKPAVAKRKTKKKKERQ